MNDKLANQDNTPNPLALINTALDKGLDVEKLTKLFDLQERWEKKEAEKAYLFAFANFQRECPKIKKNKKVGYDSKDGGSSVSYSYAPLSEIADKIKEPLSKHGLSYRWEFEDKGELIKCTCIVSHLDGHSKISEMTGPKDDSGKKNKIQQVGSTRTYLQRYSLIGALGLSSADEDIDGRGKRPVAQAVVITKSPEELQELYDKWIKEIDDLKTATELKLNIPAFLKKIKEEGAPYEKLRAYANAQYVKLNKGSMGTNNKVNLL